MQPPRIFVSSTWLDLRPERHAVEQALQRMRATRFVGMEYFGARDETTREVSLAEVDRSDIYIGVIGHRHGSGITEAEYRRALERGLPCLVYLKAGWEALPTDTDGGRLQTLRDELRARHLVTEFASPEQLAAQVAIDLHNLLFDRLVVDGLQALRSDYDARIQRFFAEYLGSASAPIAFGGRETELEALDHWFDEPTASPFALLAGPAGRGKSALLVHWSRRLARRPDVDIVFVPISIRFRTNTAAVVFGSVAARLGALHGEVVPGALDTPAEAWRALTATWLRRAPRSGRRTVLILDGLDEAADWQAGPDLLPPQLPPGVRVLVSARLLGGDADAGGWVERLDWGERAHAIDLATLSPLSMTDVLRRMSVPLDQLSTRADIVSELYRLTGGDPLLVNLYVSDLWSRGDAVARLRVEDLASFEPGLDGYFKRWWSDQRSLWGAQSPLREAGVSAVFDVLACALGPLTIAELAALAGTADAPVSVWTLEEAVRALERFVIGDGEVQGYAFTHPRLAEHFRERLARAGQAAQREARFVDWGRRCLRADDAAAQAEVPGYVLQYLRAHMQRCGRPDDEYVVLLSRRWMTAWERLDRGTYSGFAADLSTVGQIAARQAQAAAARGESSPFVAVQWRCALVNASIVSLTGEMPLAVVGALLQRCVWSPAQAIAYATRLGDALQRLRALFALTGWFDDAFRPLAVSAAAAEVQRQLPDRRSLIQQAMHDLAAAAVAAGTPADAVARTAVGLALVSHQLPGDEGAWLREILVSRLRPAAGPDAPPELPDELCVATAQALMPYLPASNVQLQHEVSWRLSMLALPTLLADNEHGALGRPAWLADRVRLLLAAWRAGTPAIDAEGRTVDLGPAAARATFGWLLLRAALTPAERNQALAFAQALLATLPDEEVLEGLRVLSQLPGWKPDADLRTLAASLDWPVNRAQALAIVQWADAALLPDAKAADLLLVAREVPANEAAHVLEAVVDWLSTNALSPWLDHLAPRLPLESFVALLRRAGTIDTRPEELGAQAREGWHAQLTRALLAALAGSWRALPTARSMAAVLTVLLEHTVTRGTADSLAPWRKRARDSKEELVANLRAVFACAAPDPVLVAELAHAMTAHLALNEPELRRAPTPPPTMSPPAGSVVALLAGYAHERAASAADDPQVQADDDALNDLHRALRQLDLAGLQEQLGALAGCADAVDAALLRDAAAGALRDLRVWDIGDPQDWLNQLRALAAPPFFPPTPALDEALAWIAQRAGQRGGGFAEGFCRAVLTTPLPDALRQPLLVGMLDTAGFDAWTEPEQALRQLPHARAALEAVLLRRAARQADGGSFSARQADGEQRARLAELQSAVQARPPVPRAQLVEALSLATRLDDEHAVEALVQRALLLRDEHPTLLAALTDAVLQLRDPVRRAALFAELAPRLPASALTPAVQRLRRIADGLPAVRAMLALLAEVRAPEAQRRAVQTLHAAVTAAPEGPDRAAACLFAAPALPVALRWPTLLQALREGADRCTAAPRTELFEQLARVLPGAPAAVLDAVLLWLKDPRRRGVVPRNFGLRLLPVLPEWDRRRALDFIDAEGRCLDMVRPWLDVAHEQRMAARFPRWPGLPGPWSAALARTAAADAVGNVADAADWWRSATDVEDAHLVSTPTDLQRLAAVCALSLQAARLDAVQRAQLIERAGDIGDAALRAEAAGYLAVFAPPELQDAARNAAHAVRAAADRAVVLAMLAAQEPPAQRQARAGEALAEAAQEGHAAARLQAVIACVRAVPSALRSARPLLDAAPDRDAARRAIATLLPLLDAADAHALLRAELEALPADQAAHGEAQRREADRVSLWLERLAGHIGPATAQALLAAAGTRLHTVALGRVLAALAPALDEPARGPALMLLDGLQTDFAWLDALLAVSRRWPDALDTTRGARLTAVLAGLGDDDVAADALIQLAVLQPGVSESDFVDALTTVHSAAHRSDALSARVHAGGATPALQAAAEAIGDPVWRSVALLHVALRADGDAATIGSLLKTLARAGGKALLLATINDLALRLGHCPEPLFQALLDAAGRPGCGLARRVVDIVDTLDADQAWRVAQLALHDVTEPAPAPALLARLAPRLQAQRRAELPALLARSCSERQQSEALADAVRRVGETDFAVEVVRFALTMRSATFGADLALPLLDVVDASLREQVLARFIDAAPHDRERRRLLRLALAVCDEPPNPQLQQRLLAWPPLPEQTEAPLAAHAPDFAGRLSVLFAEAARHTGMAGAPAAPAARPRRPLAPGAAAMLRHLRAQPTGRDRFDELLRRFDELSPTAAAELMDQLPDLFDEALQARFHAAVADRAPAALVERGLQAAARLDEVEALRAAVAAWVPRLPQAGAPAVQRVWDEQIAHAPAPGRGALLERVAALAPLLAHRGGDTSLLDSIASVAELTELWP